MWSTTKKKMNKTATKITAKAALSITKAQRSECLPFVGVLNVSALVFIQKFANTCPYAPLLQFLIHWHAPLLHTLFPLPTSMISRPHEWFVLTAHAFDRIFHFFSYYLLLPEVAHCLVFLLYSSIALAFFLRFFFWYVLRSFFAATAHRMWP